MEQIFKTKFSQEAWSNVSAPEKAARTTISGTFFEPIVKAVTPWQWGFDYGLTPELAQEERVKVETEYQELLRRQEVSRVAPMIQDTLRRMALTQEGSPTDKASLTSIFKLNELGFNEEDIAGITSYAQRVRLATPEQLASGELMQAQPLTQEEIDELARTSSEQRHVLTTVSLSQDTSDIIAALQGLYSPTPQKATGANKLIEEFTAKAITGEQAQESFSQLAKEQGMPIVLTDDSGNMYQAKKKADSSIWITNPTTNKDELLGFYDESSQSIVPVGLKGQPLLTQSERESDAKDLWDAWSLASTQVGTSLQKAITSTIPDAFLSLKQTLLEKGKIFGREEERDIKIGQLQVIRDRLQLKAEQVQLEQDQWYAAHPELAPRPEYTQDVTQHPELLKDPNYWLYTIVSNAPISAASFGVGTLTTMLTGGNVVAGALVASALMTPVQIEDVQQDLVANGATPQEASILSTSVGTAMGIVEIFPMMLALKTISPAFMKTFTSNLSKEVAGKLATSLIAKGALGTATKMGTSALKIVASETLEEVIQQSMQNAAVKTVNENRSILQDIPQTIINTAISTLPLAILGGGSEYIAMKQQLSEATRLQIDTKAKELVAAGLEPQQAEAVALTKVMESETVQAEIDLAMEKLDATIPTEEVRTPVEYSEAVQETQPVITQEAKPTLSAKYARKLESLNYKLTNVNEDIDNYTDSIQKQKDRLVKMQTSKDAPSIINEQKQTITHLEEQLTEMQYKKETLLKSLDKLQKSQEATITPTVTQEVVEEEEVTPQVAPTMEEVYPEVETKDDIIAPPIEQESPLVSNESLSPDFRPYERRPSVLDWDEEEANKEAVLKNPNISKYVKESKKVRGYQSTAGETWDATDETHRKAILKEAKLPKNLIAKSWSDLTLKQKYNITLTAIPNNSIKFSGAKEIVDMEYYMEFMEEETGLPFLQIYRRIQNAGSTAERARIKALQPIFDNPNFKTILDDDIAKRRVAQELNARGKDSLTEHPSGITENELLLVDTMTDIYRKATPKVRYLRVMSIPDTIEAFKEEFPDAVEAGQEPELAMALELKKSNKLDDLWDFLYNKSWGVYETGYDPRLIWDSSLRPKRLGLGTSRGESRLEQRKSIIYSEDAMAKDVIRRLETYEEQIEIQWQIAKELDKVEEFWKLSSNKFDLKSRNLMDRGLKNWLARVQGIPVDTGYYDQFLKNIVIQSMKAIFVNPSMSLRNFFQAVVNYSDRSELVRVLIEKMPAHIKEQGQTYFKTFVSELGGIRKSILHKDEGIKFLAPLNKLAEKLTLYEDSDYFPRLHTFMAALNKSRRATENFLKNGNVEQWIKDSGALHLRQTERNYVLTNYLGQADKIFNLATDGLESVTGTEMANLYVAQRMGDKANFKYKRSTRGIIEMGTTGSTFWSLFVYPRGYAQMLLFQAEKINNVFRGEATWEEARSGFNDILKLVVAAEIFGAVWMGLSGKKRNPWDIWSILLGWQAGGLYIGVIGDLTTFVKDLTTAVLSRDMTDKELAFNKLNSEVVSLTETFVPLYRTIIDMVDVAFGVEAVDKRALRNLRALIDKDYTPEQTDKQLMNFWEISRKVLLGQKIPEPEAFEKMMTDLKDSQDKLGMIDADGSIYTLNKFGSHITTLTKDLPPYYVDKEEGFTDLVLFYKDCEASWEEYYKLPSDPSYIRTNWRREHPEEEAMLLFWGKLSKSVYTNKDIEWKEVSKLISDWSSVYETTSMMHSKFASWE
jgi:hypothetical protein